MKRAHLTSRLRKRIVIEQPIETADGGGGFTTIWQTYDTVWAEVKPLRGKESLENMRLEDVTSYRITIRFLAGLTTKMRISYGGRTFNIRGIMNPDERNNTLEILAEEGVAT